MFNLNREIDRWKSAFAERKACSRDELQELESHLREEIAALVAAGHSEQEAFSEGASRLGDPGEVCGEFAKNERRFLSDSVAIRGNSVCVALVGLAAVMLGLAAWMRNGDGILVAHVASITFAYVVSFLLALAGTYAIFRGAIVKSGGTQFQGRFARHCRFLLGIIALGCAIGIILGGIWAQRHWGRFWGWDPREIGGLSVVISSVVFYWLVTKFEPSVVRLGQMTLILSLVTIVALFGPVVYVESVGTSVFAFFIGGLILQLSILSISLFVPQCKLAEH